MNDSHVDLQFRHMTINWVRFALNRKQNNPYLYKGATLHRSRRPKVHFAQFRGFGAEDRRGLGEFRLLRR